MRHKNMSTRKLLTSLLVICLIATGCGVQGNGQRASRTYSGEELYRGLFFGEGEVAGLVPEFWGEMHQALENVSADDLERIQGVRDQIIAEIDASFPGYFSSFSSDLHSGNPLLVRAALEGAYDKTLTVASALFPQDGSESDMSTQAICGPTFCGLVVAIAVVVVNYAAVVHSFYRELAIRADIGVTKNVMSDSIGPDATPISQDMAVALVTTRLALE